MENPQTTPPHIQPSERCFGGAGKKRGGGWGVFPCCLLVVASGVLAVARWGNMGGALGVGVAGGRGRGGIVLMAVYG